MTIAEEIERVRRAIEGAKTLIRKRQLLDRLKTLRLKQLRKETRALRKSA